MFLSVSLMAAGPKPSIQAQPVKYIMSFKDFRLHTETHVENTRRLGMALYEKYKDTEFRHVPRDILYVKLGLHDHEKLAELKELRKFGYVSERTLGERLYDYYGQDKNSDSLTPAQKERFQALIDEVNYYGGEIEKSFYQKYGLASDQPEFNEVVDKIAMIEHISDLVERQNNPVSLEEFHREKMIPAEELLTAQSEKEMARYLSDGYSGTIQTNPLEDRHLQAITRADVTKSGAKSCRGAYVN